MTVKYRESWFEKSADVWVGRDDDLVKYSDTFVFRLHVWPGKGLAGCRMGRWHFSGVSDQWKSCANVIRIGGHMSKSVEKFCYHSMHVIRIVCVWEWMDFQTGRKRRKLFLLIISFFFFSFFFFFLPSHTRFTDMHAVPISIRVQAVRREWTDGATERRRMKRKEKSKNMQAENRVTTTVCFVSSLIHWSWSRSVERRDSIFFLSSLFSLKRQVFVVKDRYVRPSVKHV